MGLAAVFGPEEEAAAALLPTPPVCASNQASTFCFALLCQSLISAWATKSGILAATASKNCVSMPEPPFCKEPLISMSMSSSSDFDFDESNSWISDTTPSATPAPKPALPDFSRCFASTASWQAKSIAFQKPLWSLSDRKFTSISASMSSASLSETPTKSWCGGVSRMVMSSKSSPSAIANSFTQRSIGRSRPCSMRMRLLARAFSRWNLSSAPNHSPYNSSCLSRSCSARCFSSN
mmetsp:Transcript_27293/g.78593  ORF Transcript_27293/g.78593 Transcript_27293/m.78593 type:complete len:236 (-) Transcript_27293:457-1164(-)